MKTVFCVIENWSHDNVGNSLAVFSNLESAKDHLRQLIIADNSYGITKYMDGDNDPDWEVSWSDNAYTAESTDGDMWIEIYIKEMTIHDRCHPIQLEVLEEYERRNI